MTVRGRQLTTVAACGLVMAWATEPAHAKPAAITGKLSKAGYTVIALAPDGRATTAPAGPSGFRLVPPGKAVTLHLRGKDGVYAGPIVVGRKAKTVLLGVKAGAKLGAVKVKSGYASSSKALAKRFVKASIRGNAKGAAPVGAKVFGRIKANGSGSAGDGRDRDLDGIPGAFDVDDDGDLILDNVDKAAAGSARMAQAPVAPPPAQPAPGQPAPGQPAPGQPAPGQPAPAQPPSSEGQGAQTGFKVFSNLKLGIEASINANAASVTDAMIDQAVSSSATLAMQVPAGDLVELDCGGLVYCSAGGTGHALEGGAFPAAYDTDGDGLGAMFRGTTGDFQLGVATTASQIGSGDAFVETITTGSATTQLPGMLNYLFSTTPALVRWADSAGGSGDVTYPAVATMAGGSASPIPVSAGADGHVVATLTLWRPQRKAIEGSGEGTGWIDIGRLGYKADIPNGPSSPGPGAPGGQGQGRCDAAAYSTTDPNLAVSGDRVVDGLEDKPAAAGNTLSFTVDLTRCLTQGGAMWGAGQKLGVDIQAVSNYGDNAAQKVYFTLR